MCLTLNTVEVHLNCEYAVSDFEFSIDGLSIIDAYGGAATNADFNISIEGNIIYGQATSDDYVASDAGHLLTISFDSHEDQICFGESAITTYVGFTYEAVLINCIIPGCTDESACTFNENATDNDGSCLFLDCAGVCGGGAENCPDWEDNPGAYEFASFLVAGIVLYDDVQMGDEGDELAAIGPDGTVRGVAIDIGSDLDFGPYAFTPLWEMTMRSNNQGETISFQYYDASEDVILDVSTSYTFTTNDQLGDVFMPYELIITSSVDLSIDLIAGFNWISFNVDVEDASLGNLLGSVADDAIFIASQASGTATNYGAYGWYGSLATLSPGNGYLLEMGAAGTLVYPEFDGLARLVDNKQDVLLDNAISEWDFNYADYRYMGAVTLSVEDRSDNTGDVVAAFIDGECRGVAERMYFPFDDNYMYIVQVYSNVAEGEEVTFKYYDSVNNEVVDYTESVSFESFMNVGDGFNTVSLSQSTSDMLLPGAYAISDAYPNPFNPVTSFEFTMPEDGMVRISVYDVSGREVVELVNGYQTAGTYPVTWDASNLSSGVYMLHMTADNFSTIQKVMLIK